VRPRRLLGVFAHPDDEVFCAGGTLARYTASGAEAMVVSATRGEAGQIRDASRASRRTLGTVREAELRESCARLGVAHVRCLDHLDGSLASADRAALTMEVVHILDDFRPDAVITFGPDGAYGHPDHLAIGEVTAEAVIAAGDPDVRLFLSLFPRSRLLLADRLSTWLVELHDRFRGEGEFGRAFSLFATESGTMGFASDHMEVAWFAPGLYVVEQGEPATGLFLILTGEVEVRQEQVDGSSRLLRTMGPGEFFGELGVLGGTRTSDVIAVDSVTCLVFSPAVPTEFAGRGGVSPLPLVRRGSDEGRAGAEGTTVIDVSAHIDQKVAAIAAHRTQYPIDPALFPRQLLVDMLGIEHFVRTHPVRRPDDDLFA
jgi:LmbE family N-acetylglucosaminyl deacetylase